MLKKVLKEKTFQIRDAWSIIGLLLPLPVFYIFSLAPIVEGLFPSLGPTFLDQVLITSNGLLVLGYCMEKFGYIELAELLPRWEDLLILVVAIIMLLWKLTYLLGPHGINSPAHDSIRNLPTIQYCFAVIAMVALMPLIEEALFRRYFFEILSQHYTTSKAVLLTVGIATLFHIGRSVPGLLLVGLNQLLFTIVYFKSRLGVAVLVHALANGLILFFSRQ